MATQTNGNGQQTEEELMRQGNAGGRTTNNGQQAGSAAAPQEGIDGGGEAQPTNETNAMRGRALLRHRMHQRYPERNWEDEGDDAEADQVMADYDEMEGKVKDYDERNRNMDELFKKNPKSAAFIFEMARKGDDKPASRVRKFFGDEIAEMMLDPDVDDDKLDAAFEERQKNLKKIEEQEAQDKENWGKLLEHWQNDHDKMGLSIEDANKVLSNMEDFINRYMDGKLTDEDLVSWHKGMTYDKDMATATREAELEGRNAQIEEKMRKSKGEKSELPNLGGQSRGGAAGKPIRGGINQKMGNVGPGIWDS